MLDMGHLRAGALARGGDKGEEMIQIYCGEGKGKSTAAIGQGIEAAGRGKSVFIIQFLKGKNENTFNFLKKLEPDIKMFRFEKAREDFADLSEECKQEERQNIKNGLNFAKKVMLTRECNVLILDEVLGLLDLEIIPVEELEALLGTKHEDMEIILTGRILDWRLKKFADKIYEIATVK